MMEWTVVCGRSLTAAKRVRAVVNVAHLTPSHEAKNSPEVFKPLLSGFLWLTKRSWEGCVAIVLVQMLLNLAQVPVFESLTPFVDEFDLWGIGAIWAGHWGGAAEGEFSKVQRWVKHPGTFPATSSHTDPLGREWATGN